MSAPLYNLDILRLAAAIPHHRRLEAADASAERRSPTCGSRVTVDVRLDRRGRIADIGLDVRACALGQASAALLGASAVGRDAEEIIAARDALSAYLSGASDMLDFWPGIEVLGPARGYPARHASIRLSFEALTDAIAAARDAAAA